MTEGSTGGSAGAIANRSQRSPFRRGTRSHPSEFICKILINLQKDIEISSSLDKGLVKGLYISKKLRQSCPILGGIEMNESQQFSHFCDQTQSILTFCDRSLSFVPRSDQASSDEASDEAMESPGLETWHNCDGTMPQHQGCPRGKRYE